VSLAQCQAFMGFLRAGNHFGESDLQRILKQYGRMDRRMGQLSSFYGLLSPELIPKVLEYQTRESAKRFGECAIGLNLMTDQQVERMLRIQNDDLFQFSQSAVLVKLSSMDAMLRHLSTFRQTHEKIALELPKSEDEQKEKIIKVKRILKSINAIAPLPSTAAKAFSMMNDPDVNIDELGKVLAMDPSFVGILLKMVNSAFYGLRSRISNVKNALVVVGLTKLRSILLAAAVMEKFKNVPASFAVRFWEHSVLTAEWTKELGHYFRMREADELFVAGILHNVGELLAQQHFRPEQTAIDKLVEGGHDRLDAEREHLGGTHADLGSYLLNLWQLPAEIVQSTLLHHHDLPVVLGTPNIKKDVILVHLGVALANVNPDLDDYSYREDLTRTMDRYRQLPFDGIGTLNVDLLYERVSASVSSIQEMFQQR